MIVIQLPDGPTQVYVNNISRVTAEIVHAKLHCGGQRRFRHVQVDAVPAEETSVPTEAEVQPQDTPVDPQWPEVPQKMILLRKYSLGLIPKPNLGQV